MKRLLCALLAIMLLLGCACAEGTMLRVGFEDGFSLNLPEGWLHYPVGEEMTRQGVNYCLSDASAQRWLYIQIWKSECADADELAALIERTASPRSSGAYSFNGVDCVIYDLAAGDVSCCAALLDGSIVNFVFTPQSDGDYMMTAAQIMSSICPI